MLFNKKGISEEGSRFNLKEIAVWIVFLAALTIGIIIIIPVVTSQSAGSTMSNFGVYLWNTLTGGG